MPPIDPEIYSWMMLRGSVKIEASGIRFKGGSRTALVKRRLGLPSRTPVEDVLAALDAKINSLFEEKANA